MQKGSKQPLKEKEILTKYQNQLCIYFSKAKRNFKIIEWEKQTKYQQLP